MADGLIHIVDYKHGQGIQVDANENSQLMLYALGAYFDAKTKLHLEEYLLSRTDNNEALFVHLKKPHNRLNISGIEIRVRKLGQKLCMIVKFSVIIYIIILI